MTLAPSSSASLTSNPKGVLGIAGLLINAALLAGCASAQVEPSATPRPTSTPTATTTSTTTPTPTNTPTPTATAPPATVAGDLRATSLAEPIRQAGAPCGLVDTLDFPLDPPHGARARGGGDYGRYRARFSGYHVGEDWRIGNSSFGQPVYSIGHGRVTYAQPNGWGADKGVVIVEHTFRDRRRIHSFYGHLDPPSVELRAGQCVERGDQIGNIGDPRSPPHLHFEIRLHLPETPGPGYWPSHPTRAGWRPPSATVWDGRMASLPGLLWTHLGTLGSLGVLEGGVLAISSSGEILALDLENGEQQWSQPLPPTIISVLLDAAQELLFFVHGNGIIEAIPLADYEVQEAESPAKPLWSTEVPASFSGLAALPRGGLVAFTREGAFAISRSGDELWHEGNLTGPADQAEINDGLIVAARSGVWLIDEEGAVLLTDTIDGQKVAASTNAYIYAEDGIYSLRSGSRSAAPLFELPRGFPRSGDVLELPTGGILVAHLDQDDKRLVAIDAGGNLIWERSIADLNLRAVHLLEEESEVFMLMQHNLGASTGVDLFWVDTDTGDLLRIFSGGTRSSAAIPPTIREAGGSFLIAIPGVGISYLDPQLALQAALDQ